MKSKIIIPALIVLTGCGGGGAGPSGDMSTFVNNNRFMMGVKMLLTDLQKNPMVEGNILSSDVQPLFAPDYSLCSTFQVGSATTDNHFRVKYDCSSIPDGGLLYDKKGTFERKVIDGADLTKGYRYDYDLVLYNVDANGKYYDNVDKGYLSNTKSSTTFTLDHDFSSKIKSNNYAPILLDWSWRRVIKQVITPDDMSNPMTTGKMVYESMYEMSGKMGPDQNGRQTEGTFRFAFKSKDLTYDSACNTSFYNSGSIIFTDGAQNELEVHYECNDITATFNGVEVDTW